MVVQTRIASLATQSLLPIDDFQSTIFRLSELLKPWTRLAQTNTRTLATNNGCRYTYRTVNQVACLSEVMRIAGQRPLWLHPPVSGWASFARQYASPPSGDANQDDEGETEIVTTANSEAPLPKVLSVTQDRHLKVTTWRHDRIFLGLVYEVAARQCHLSNSCSSRQ